MINKLKKLFWKDGNKIDVVEEEIALKYIRAAHETLEWALDLIDMYDEYLSEIDGKEKIYTEVHVKGKEQARTLIANMKDLFKI